MTGPAGSTTTPRGRIYTWTSMSTGRTDTFVSVTTALDAIPKPALKHWAARCAAEKAVEMAVAGTLDVSDDAARQATIDVLCLAHEGARDRAAGDGSAIHRAIERSILGGEPIPVTTTQAPRYRQFQRFVEDFTPEWEASEATVYNRAYGYAGTLDAIATINGCRLLLDVKTGKGIYPETALQLAAYSRGEFIGIRGAGGGFGDVEHMMPRVDGAAILHLRPRSYQLVEVSISDATFDAFLAVLASWHAIQGLDRFMYGRIPKPHTTESDEALFRRLSGEAA